MKTWLNGGLIGGGIGLVLYFIDWIKCMSWPRNSGPPGYCNLLNNFVISFHVPFNGTVNNVILDNKIMPGVSLIVTLILYFIIGVIIGEIIGKIKSKKRDSKIKIKNKNKK